MTSEFLSHLEELRRRLLMCFLAFLVASGGAFFYSSELIDVLILPFRRPTATQLFFQKPYEAFLTHLTVSALAGILIASPFILAQFWLFIAPGLYEKEKKMFLAWLGASLSFFFAGAAFAFLVVIPWGLQFLLNFQTETMKPLLAVGPYFSFVAGMILVFGVLFNFPVVILALIRLGVLKTAALARSRRVVIVLIFILAAVLTPAPDPVSQCFLALPLILLFEGTLLLARFYPPKR